MIEVEINSIRVNLISQHRIVLLKDLHAERYLPIWIGQYEADAITTELHEKRPHQRPLTHDLLKNVIEEMGGTIVHILINDMRKDIFFARLVVDVKGERIEIDSRPSDAIAIAVRAKAPIFVAEVVMDKSAVEPEDEIDMDEETSAPERRIQFGRSQSTDDLPDTLSPKEDEVLEEVDESQFSAFADFMNQLDFEDLDDSDEN
jgi:bifunctional DNase/RNase